MRKLNKKGFTLVEIIAVVAILAVLSVIGMVSVNSIIQNGKKEHYRSAEKTLKMSAESYAQANRNYLPKNVGEMKKVTLRTLVQDNYIEQIQDYYDNSCDLDKSYVQIFKYSKDDYSYLTYLDCPDYSNEKENNELKPNITINMTSPTENTVKKVTTDVTINDDSKLLSYSITIYRDKNADGNENEVYTTGNVEANYEKNISKSKDIGKFTPGKIKVVVKATNIYGNSETLTKTETYKDKQGPECIFYPEYDFSDDDWVSADRKVTVGCDDGEEGSGCAREKFTQTFKEDAKDGIIKIKDNAGNITECPVKVHVDKTKPETCSVTHTGDEGLNDWYVSNATVTLTNKDNMSGVKYKSLTTSSTAPTSAAGYNGKTTDTQTEIATIKWYGYLEDKAGNKTKCESTSFKVDTTAPTKPSGGSITLPGSTKKVNLGEVSGSTDATSGWKEYRYVVKNDATVPTNADSGFTTSTEFTRDCGKSYYAYAIAVDNAGNKSAVHTIGTNYDNKDEYVNYSTCTKVCDGGTQTASNECALITKTDTRDCNTRKCCTDTTIRRVTTNTCSADCDGGTKKREAYSTYFTENTHRCTSFDDWNGGSCNTRGCCSSVYYEESNTCSADCDGGNYKRKAYSDYTDERCSSEDDWNGSACNTDACYVEPEPEPEPPVYNKQCYANLHAKSGSTVTFKVTNNEACAISNPQVYSGCTAGNIQTYTFSSTYPGDQKCSYHLDIKGYYKWNGGTYDYIEWWTKKSGSQFCTNDLCI